MFFSPRNGVVPPSGQLITSAPLSVEYITIVLSAMPRLVELVEQLPDHAVVLDHAIGIEADAGDALRRGLEVGPDVHPGGVPPQEERLARGGARSMKSSAPSVTSTSTVFIRFLVSGPVSSIVCVPSGLAIDLITPRGPNLSLKVGSFG